MSLYSKRYKSSTWDDNKIPLKTIGIIMDQGTRMIIVNIDSTQSVDV